MNGTNALEQAATEHLDVILEGLTPQAVGEQMADLVLAQIPQLDRIADTDLRTGAVASCTSNIAVIWERLRSGAPAHGIEPPTEALAWSRELVHRGVDLAALLRTYRVGQEFAEGQIIERMASLKIPDEIRWRLLARISGQVFGYVDSVCTQLVEDYEAEHARWVRGAAAARAETVGAILARRPVDPAVATQRLQYDVSRRHRALIVWSEDAELSRPPGTLEQVAAVLARSLSGGPVLTIPIGENVIWAWTSGNGDVAATGELVIGEPGVRAALGGPGRGVAGMADSHDDALAARRAAALIHAGAQPVVSYHAAGLLALLTAAPAEAVRFAETELGELAGDGDAALRVRATLRVHLEENLSPARTARRLGIHHNTVVYRVKQAEEMLGRPVDERRLELEVALRLSERLGPLRAARDRNRAQ